MSSYTNFNWVYRIYGKNISLYVIKEFPEGSPDQLGRFDADGTSLLYPDESITNGLMFEGTAFIEPFVDNDPNELSGNDNPTLSLTGSVDETKHVNFSRMLSLAIVDYLRAQLSEKGGDVQKKEYYMREFWGKVGDEISNKQKITMCVPSFPYAVR